MSNLKLAHIVLQTNKLGEMRDWYCTVLGAHVVQEAPSLSFITFDEEHHRVAFVKPPEQLEARSPYAAGLHHTAYTFDHLDQLLDRYNALKTDGIEPFAPIQHGLTTSIYYSDPDGNLVEMVIENFADAHGQSAYMNGPEFEADPVGVSFDPAKMLAAREAGTPVEQLITRQWALRTSPELPHPLEVLAQG
jgi:catechol 2,3-dioxygenase-like lactoylglutathione lyase family enzyme